MYPESSTSNASSLPMAPLSGQWLPKYAIRSHPSHAAPTTAPITSSTSASLSNTSLEITIVTTEQAPNGIDGTTTTIERKLKMCLALPASYSTKQLKSLNVRLHQDAPAPTTNPVATVSLEQPTPYGNHCSQGSIPAPVPSSSAKTDFHEYNHNNTMEAQQLWRQKQLLRLYQAAKNQDVLPATVASSQDCVDSTKSSATNTFMPRPETVSSSSLSSSAFDSSSSFSDANHGNESIKKRRRSTRSNEEARKRTTTATQSSLRKKQKVKP